MEKKAQKNPSHNLIGIILLILLWIGLISAGFWYTKLHIEQITREIQETNSLNIQALEEQIQLLRTEMNDIQEALAQTDKTLSSTNTASEEVNQRIVEMDEHLKELEKSLNILKENGNEDY